MFARMTVSKATVTLKIPTRFVRIDLIKATDRAVLMLLLTDIRGSFLRPERSFITLRSFANGPPLAFVPGWVWVSY